MYGKRVNMDEIEATSSLAAEAWSSPVRRRMTGCGSIWKEWIRHPVKGEQPGVPDRRKRDFTGEVSGSSIDKVPKN